MNVDQLHTTLKLTPHSAIENNDVDVMGTSFREILINETHVHGDNLTFKDIRFQQKVYLKNFKLKGNISFTNCKFMDGLVIHGIEANAGSVKTEFEHKGCLTLYKCTFAGNNILQISQNSVLNGMTEIVSCGHIKSLTIFNTKFSHLRISRCEIDDQYLFQNNTFESELRLEKSAFHCQIRHENNAFGSLVLMENRFEKDLFFKDQTLANSLSITGNTCEEGIQFDPFDSVGGESTLTLVDNTLKKGIKFSNYHEGGCRNIYIGPNTFGNGLVITGKNKFDEEDPFVKKMDLVLSNNSEGLMKVSDIDIGRFQISGENYKGNIILKDIVCEDVNIRSLANYSNLQFVNLQPLSEASKLSIVDSHLEKVTFVNSQLHNFKTYNIMHSNFSLIKSANTKWFTYEQLHENIGHLNKMLADNPSKGTREVVVEHKEITFLEIKETFRQLKYAMDQQGDRVMSLRFRSYEMEAYFRALQITKKRHNIDRLILFLGKSNEHGINWSRPLKILLIMTVCFYVILFYAASPDYVFGYGELNIKKFVSDLWEYKRVVPQMFNPTHSVEKMFPEGFNISGYLMTFDLLYKIVFSYLVFQTISAFRKFIK
jgi:hypothetical protein